MKVFKISTALQLLYCLACLVLALWMPLYSAYYTTDFGRICLKVGGVLFLISGFNPMGLICSAVNLVVFCSTDLKKSKKALAWVITAPILIVLCWVLAITSYISHTGGV
ncbi:MAG: hypothetical protein IJW65_02655 [Clostridia bacterium]|nr:hypothetical protein [Clostridia bacterium]